MVKKEDLRQSVKDLMKSNEMEWDGNRYTRPAPTTYEQQWLWDSCFHAIINIHLDADMAKDELRSLLYHKGTELGGMVPHMVYWNGGGEELWGQNYGSTITQPPLIARATLLVYEATQDKSFICQIYDPLRRHYDWLLKNRDGDGDYLISIVHPWESGWDASPRWDAALSFTNPTAGELLGGRLGLARKLKEHFSKNPFSVWKDFMVEPVDFNALFSDSLFALAEIAKRIGHNEDSLRYRDLASKVNQAISTKMWDENTGYYWDLLGDNEAQIKIPSSASFITLFAGIPSMKQAQRLVNQMLSHYWTDYPIPTVPIDHPAFSPNEYWRGNTWLNLNWLIIKGLERYGFQDLAKILIEKSVLLTRKAGFREYYNPITGEGLGSDSHSWSGIILDLINSSSNAGFVTN